MHILLIDDSSSTRSLLRTLVNSGQAVRHEISEAASGEEALQKVGSGEINLPDLIIVDINMTGMTGYDLCRQFRAKHGTGSEFVPYIIIITANEGVDVINQALESGANDYMPKPVNVKILQVRLRVAERLLSHAREGGGSGPLPKTDKSGPLIETAKPAQTATPAAPVAPLSNLQQIAADSLENTDAACAVLDVSGDKPSFNIVYANFAMASTTQFSQDDLAGKSLAELEAWTPEFLSMVLSYVGSGQVVSHIPLWSHTHQSVPVHLSFFPIRGQTEKVDRYLVVHHF